MPYYYLDADGNHLPVIDHAVAWLTCPHDEGYGACRRCIDAGDTTWAAQKGTKTEYDFDDAAEALDWVNG